MRAGAKNGMIILYLWRRIPKVDGTEGAGGLQLKKPLGEIQKGFKSTPGRKEAFTIRLV